jgi:Arc/MetJ-type ribon-helix-helix transcriptional regulator
MTRQIAVRLPDDIVDFIDQSVAEGRARSRAAVVARAVEGERRRQLASRDVEILTGSPPDDDLDDLARYAAKVPLERD